MVDSNIQREDILPSEKSKAYRMKYDAMKHQGSKAGGLTLGELGEAAGESAKTVQRYIWISRLADELLDMVDTKKIGIIQAVDLSFLSEDAQRWVLAVISENQTFGSSEIETQEVGESNPNYTKYNKADLNYIEESHINPIIQSGSEKNDVIDDVQKFIELIKENISYNHHMQYDSYGEKELYDELFQVICEVVCVRRPTIRVAGEEYPYELVKSRFLKLESSHLEYVIDCMKNTTTKITNIKAYMITALYNATTTINHFYQQEVNYDMYGGGWCKKDII
jgi:replication initiator protein A (repA) N-terminus